ncbi:MAG: MrpF/PhaF family protein [Myxococcales bacterium]|nr:MrpF/PhaF family protein [Myxococcales bacterium]MDP3499006.1 MrpF/PhaF family protein [Myxococcales bacterium]
MNAWLWLLFGLLGFTTLLLAVAFARARHWLTRVIIVDAVSVLTACAVAVLAATRRDEQLLDAAILVALVAVVGTTALLHFMPLRRDSVTDDARAEPTPEERP